MLADVLFAVGVWAALVSPLWVTALVIGVRRVYSS